MSRRVSLLSAAVVIGLGSASFAATGKIGAPRDKSPLFVGGPESVVVDLNLGSLGAGIQSLVGTTVGATNDVDTYVPGGNPAAIWDQDYTYQFTTASPFVISFTSNDPDGATADNDFWLLTSTTTTTNSNGLREATQVGPTAFINGSYGQQPAGTYYFSVDAWRGVPTVAGTPAAGRATAFNVQLSLSAPPPPPTILYTGALATTDATFFRPIAGNPPTSLGTTSTYYDVVPFYVTTSGLYSFEQGNSTFDDYMFLYTSPVNPSNPLAGIVEGDDDDGVGANALIERNLVAGQQYYLVNTSFAALATGAYDVTVVNSANGIAVLGVVPEPMTLSAIAGLGMLAVRRRRA